MRRVQNTGIVLGCGILTISDFTYDSYHNLLGIIYDNRYIFANYHNNADIKRPCIIRHDIDLDVGAALRFAKLENSFSSELKSTYFVLLSSDFYNIFSKGTLVKLDAIITIGHELGFHFDETKYNGNTLESLSEAVQEEAFILGRALGIGIKAVSMHRPSKRILDANISFPGLENSYSWRFINDFKYLSDSRMRWRENAEEIIASQEYESLHILTHAFWYSDKKETTREKLTRFITDSKKKQYDNLSDNFINLEEFILREEI